MDHQGQHVSCVGLSHLLKMDSGSEMRVPCVPPGHTHLSLLHCHGLSAGCDLFIDAGQEVLRDAKGVLQQGMIGVAGRSVLQQVLPQVERLESDREQNWHRPTFGVNSEPLAPQVSLVLLLKGLGFAVSAIEHHPRSRSKWHSNKPMPFVQSQKEVPL